MAKTETPRTPDISATIEGTCLTFTFANGAPPLVIYAAELLDDIRTAACMHGLKQKIGDAAAMSRDPETGRSATLSDKRAAMVAVAERLRGGAWNAERGEGTGAGGVLFQALCRMFPERPRDEVRERLAGMSKAEQAAMRKNPRIATIIAEIQAAAASAGGIDSDKLLGEF